MEQMQRIAAERGTLVESLQRFDTAEVCKLCCVAGVSDTLQTLRWFTICTKCARPPSCGTP